MPEENDKKELDADDIVIDETENIEDTPKAEPEEILSDQKKIRRKKTAKIIENRRKNMKN